MCKLLGGGEWVCGRSATRLLRDLTDNGGLSCTPHSRHPYGRIVSSYSVNGMDLGFALIDAGLAWAFVEYSNMFVEQEKIARSAGLGGIAACS
ncbi:thermonuclease family protein [Yoonia sp. MH D7]